eukprot:g10696.t1
MAGRRHNEERACSDKSKEAKRAKEMDELGREVFNLKLALQEYEDRLAKLYQTEDRSQWKGPATLITDLEIADRDVDRLEHTVASLRDQLRQARGRSGGDCGGDSAGSEEKSECMLSARTREDQYEAEVEELRDQIAALEEDNRVLADAAGWELCEGSEGEEEDALVVPTGPSQRIRVIEALNTRMKELTLLLDSALVRENDARVAAEDALARMDDAVARTEELQAAVLHYKRGKVSAQGRETALKSELDELRSRGDGEGVSADKEEKAGVSVGVMARLTGPEEASTKATGVNTEEKWPGADAASDRLSRLEADALRWREACERTDAQLREERGLGEQTAQRLSEHEIAVRELTERLREAEGAVAAATAAARAAELRTRLPTGVRPVSFEPPTAGSFGDGDGSNTAEHDGIDENCETDRRAREEQRDEQPFTAADLAAEAATAEAATSDASNGSYDTYICPAASTASTDEDAVWKGRARASADTNKYANHPARKNTDTGRDSAEGGHTRTSSPCSSGKGRRGGRNNNLPARKDEATASGGVFHGEEGYGEGGQAGRACTGQQQKQKQHLQGRPRWATQTRDVKETTAAGGGRRVGGLKQKQQPEEELSIEGLDLDPRPPGFRASSSRRRRRRTEVEEGIGEDFGGDGDDVDGDIIDDDELSTAECSAETTGGGRDAVGVSFGVASDESGVSFDEDQAVGGSENRTPPQPRRGWERCHQHQRPQHQGSDGWRTEDGAEHSSSIQPLAAVAEGVPARGGERGSSTLRAESAARRAEASAARAERAAESARLHRDGAELAAVEAGAVAAVTKAALKTGGVPAPSHGQFTGASTHRPQPNTPRLQDRHPAGVGEVFACQSECSDTESRRAARLAERASLMGRLEALAAATEAERAARSAAGRRSQVRSPFIGSTANVDTTDPEEREGARDWWLEGADVPTDGLESVAAVEPTSGSGVGASSTAGTGKPQASYRTPDVDYWNRPVAMAAAEAVATKTSQRNASRRHRTSSKGSRSKPPVASAEGGEPKNGLEARFEYTGGEDNGFSEQRDNRHGPSLGVSRPPTVAPPLPPLSEGRRRLAQVGVGQARAQCTAAVDEAAAAQEARRRRVLQHVEVGRGGEENYRDTAKQRAKSAENGPLPGLGFDGSADAFDDMAGKRFSAQQRRPASPEKFVRPQVANSIVGGAGGARTGMARSTLRPKKNSTKKRKSRPAPRPAAQTAPLGGRQALGYVHAHGALCARRCASPACPCGEPAALAATAWRFRSGVVGTRR